MKLESFRTGDMKTTLRRKCRDCCQFQRSPIKGIYVDTNVFLALEKNVHWYK